MKTKIFTKNKQGKIEFTERELKALLDEIYNDGYNDGSKKYYYTTPYYYHWPYYGSTTPITYCTTNASTAGNSGITISASDYSTGSTTITTNNDCNCDKKKSTYTYTVKTRD